jgi:hypothetical protein
MKLNKIVKIIIIGVILYCAVLYIKSLTDRRLLNKIIERLTADSRIAEVVVTEVKFDPLTKKTKTTIKFLEYDTKLKPLTPKYFTFSSNIIQFQSMVIRFDDFYVERGHPLKGRSAYLFIKAFALNDKGAEVFEINRINEVPRGYKIGRRVSGFEKRLWERFWQYALEPKEAKKIGVKNAQIEAPGTKFIPRMFYTVKIEHDGGMRIDAQPFPQILKEEHKAGHN